MVEDPKLSKRENSTERNHSIEDQFHKTVKHGFPIVARKKVVQESPKGREKSQNNTTIGFNNRNKRTKLNLDL